MGYAWCFHDMNLSGSISFPHISCCFTAFSCLGWEKASSCFQLWLENHFISPSQLSLHREAWPAAPCWHRGSPVAWGGTRAPAARNPLGCRLTRCRRGQEHKGLGLQTLNGVKLYAAPAEMIAPLVVEENCTRMELKASELLAAAGRNESLVGRGYLWKGRPPLAGARIRSHSCRVGKRHCWTTAVVIYRACFHTAPHVSYTYGTMHGDCQGNESTTKASAN